MRYLFRKIGFNEIYKKIICLYNIINDFKCGRFSDSGLDGLKHKAKDKLICPWARSETPGYANGGNKLDLTKWDGDYFKRLRGFVAEAGKRGVVVELVLFCPFYKDDMWRLSPMNAANNVNGVGRMKRTEAYTLKDPKLLAVQDAMVRKIVEELKDFDNLYYEICNVPYFGGVNINRTSAQHP